MLICNKHHIIGVSYSPKRSNRRKNRSSHAFFASTGAQLNPTGASCPFKNANLTSFFSVTSSLWAISSSRSQLTLIYPSRRRSNSGFSRYNETPPNREGLSLANGVKGGTTMPRPFSASTIPGWTENTRSWGCSRRSG